MTVLRGRTGPGRRRICTIAAIAGVAATVVLGLWVTPPDVFMHNYVRLLYIHPPMAWVSFLAYGVAFLASLAYLWPRPGRSCSTASPRRLPRSVSSSPG